MADSGREIVPLPADLPISHSLSAEWPWIKHSTTEESGVISLNHHPPSSISVMPRQNSIIFYQSINQPIYIYVFVGSSRVFGWCMAFCFFLYCMVIVQP